MLYLAQICTVAAEPGDTLDGEHSEQITKHQSWAVSSVVKFRVPVASKAQATVYDVKWKKGM